MSEEITGILPPQAWVNHAKRDGIELLTRLFITLKTTGI